MAAWLADRARGTYGCHRDECKICGLEDQETINGYMGCIKRYGPLVFATGPEGQPAAFFRMSEAHGGIEEHWQHTVHGCVHPENRALCLTPQ
jgi:hypothetical protein